jgi:hypothetical protein
MGSVVMQSIDAIKFTRARSKLYGVLLCNRWSPVPNLILTAIEKLRSLEDFNCQSARRYKKRSPVKTKVNKFAEGVN